MSIIHDALKKAEASKAQKPGDAAPDPAAELIAKMAPAPKKKAASPRAVILAATLCLALVAVAMFGKPLLKRFTSSPDVGTLAVGVPIAANNGAAPTESNVPSTVIPAEVATLPAEDPKTGAEKKTKRCRKTR